MSRRKARRLAQAEDVERPEAAAPPVERAWVGRMFPPLAPIDRLARADAVWAALTFAAAIAVYLATLPPSITFEDSGEFVSSSATLGIAHAPGYPLYTILAHLFSRLPLGGTAAWRVALFSSVCGAGGAALLYLALRRFGVSRVAAACGGLLAAYSRTQWSQAVVAEVYALNFLLMMVTLVLLRRFERAPSLAAIAWFAFAYGIAWTNHFIIGLYGPVFAFHILSVDRRLALRPRTILTAAAAFAAGLLVYLYLPIRSSMDPLVDWGHPATWDNFWYVVRRSQFAGADVEVGVTIAERLLHFRDFLVNASVIDLGPLVLPFLILGLVRLVRAERRFALTTGLMVLGNSLGLLFILSFHYNPTQAFVFRVYLINALALAAMWAGVGLDTLHVLLARAPFARPLLFAVPAAAVMTGLATNDLHRDDLARRHASAILATLPKDAILIGLANDCDVFPLLYAQIVEHERPDVLLFDEYGLAFNRYRGKPLLDRVLRGKKEIADYQKRLEEIVAAEKDRPVYYAIAPDGKDAPKTKQSGILYRRVQGDEPVPEIDFPALYGPILALKAEQVPNDMARFVVAGYHVRYAAALATAGKRAEAQAELTIGRELSRGKVDILPFVGRQANHHGFFELGQSAFEEAQQLQPHAARGFKLDILWSRLEYLEAINDLPGRERELRAVLKLVPGQPIATASLASILFARGQERGQSGNCDAALPALREARALGYDPAWTLGLIGICLANTGKNDEGIESLRSAIAAAPPGSPTAEAMRGNLASILRRLGRTEEAERLLGH